MGGIKVCFNSF